MSREERTAIHEAGHAVASHLLDVGFTEVTIVPTTETSGHVAGDPVSIERHAHLPRDRRQAELGCVLWAGLEAEYAFTGTRQVLHGGLGDMRDMLRLAAIAGGMFGEDDWLRVAMIRPRSKFPRQTLRRAEELIAENVVGVRAVADELLRVRTLDRPAVAEILAAKSAVAA